MSFRLWLTAHLKRCKKSQCHTCKTTAAVTDCRDSDISEEVFACTQRIMDKKIAVFNDTVSQTYEPLVAHTATCSVYMLMLFEV